MVEDGPLNIGKKEGRCVNNFSCKDFSNSDIRIKGVVVNSMKLEKKNLRLKKSGL